MFIWSVTLLWHVNYAKLLNLEKLPGISCGKMAVTWIVRCYSVRRRFFSIAQMWTTCAVSILCGLAKSSPSLITTRKIGSGTRVWSHSLCRRLLNTTSICLIDLNTMRECIVHGEWQLYGSCREYISVNMISSLNHWDKLKVCFECGLFSEQWAGHGRWTCSKTDVMLLTGACLGGCSEYSLVTWISNTMPRRMMRSSVAADPPQRSTFAAWHY